MRRYINTVKKIVPSVFIIIILVVTVVFIIQKNKEVSLSESNINTEDVLSFQLHLNGFVLGQHASVPEYEFGKPYKTIKPNTENETNIYGEANIYQIGDESYMVFSVYKPEFGIINSIQITGDKSVEMSPFLGLRLGDSKEKVIETLGAPSRIEKGTINADLYLYDDRNYSVEINSSNLLYSIRIFWDQYFANKDYGNTDEDFWGNFIISLNSSNEGEISKIIMPDIEIFRKEDVYKIMQRFDNEMSDRNSDIINYLLYSPDSVKNILASYKGEIEQNIRMTEENVSGWVFKFPDSEILSEIFFRYEFGNWRVWEIKYKN